MTEVKTYDPAEVLVVVAGLIITGFAQGSFIELSPAEASFRDDYGVDGEPVRWAARNPYDTLVLTLAQTAPANALLSNLYNADLVTHAFIFPVMIHDLNANVLPTAKDVKNLELPTPALPSTFVSARGWIPAPPSITFGSSPSPRRWSLRLLNTAYIVSGSNEVDKLAGTIT